MYLTLDGFLGIFAGLLLGLGIGCWVFEKPRVEDLLDRDEPRVRPPLL